MNMSVGVEQVPGGINFGVRRRMDHGVSAERVVHAVEGHGPRRPRHRRADDQPGAGLDQPVRRRAVRTLGAHRRAPQGHDQRDHPGAVGHHGLADLPLPLGAAAPHLVRLRQQPGRRQQRHLHDGLPVHGHRRRGRRRRSRRSARATTVNCGRGAALSQFNLRVSKGFSLGHGMHIEGYRRGVQHVQRDQPGVPGAARARRPRFFTGTLASHTPNTVFMKPTAFAGDAGQPEQRVGQIGFRFTF